MRKKRILLAVLTMTLGVCALTGCGKTGTPETDSVEREATASAADTDGEETVTTITLLTGTSESLDGLNAVCDLAEEKIGVKVDVQSMTNDEQVKTLLVSGDMCDILAYQSGALLSSLNPSEYFIDLSSDTEIMDRMDDSFVPVVTIDGAVYGIPKTPPKGGGILYNKKIYEEYNLEVPKTWNQFIENCEILKDAGETAVIGSFSDAWSTQYALLADNGNVLKKDPEFAEKLTTGTDCYSANEYALRSFEKLTELTPFYNEDYLATTYSDACDMLAEENGVHYLGSSAVLTNIYSLYGEEAVNNIGFFAIPADEEADTTLTVWMPDGLYGNKNSDKQDAIIRFLEFYMSEEALDAYTAAVLPDGPYCVKDYELPEQAYDAVKNDLQAYFDDGKTQPAMEFIVDIKGVNCPAICQEAGSGQTTAKEAAEKYDDDCRLQAQQLGYEWAK